MASIDKKALKSGPAKTVGLSDDTAPARITASYDVFVYVEPQDGRVVSSFTNAVYRTPPPPALVRKSFNNFVYTMAADAISSLSLVNYVYASPPFRLASTFKNYVYSTDSTLRSYLQIGQFYNQITYDTSYQFEFSNSSVNQVVSATVFESLEALPISKESVNSFVHLVACSVDYDTTSTKFVGQYTSIAAHASPQTRLVDVWSNTRVLSEALLVCQSLDIEYVPRSGVDAAQVFNLSVSSLPVEWETRPAYAVTVRQLVTQARPPEGLPRSNASAHTVTALASFPSTPDPRVGVVNVPQIYSLTSIPVEPDPKVGMIIGAQNVTSVAISSPIDLPLSYESVNQVVGLAAFQGDDRMPISNEDVPFVASAAAVESTFEWGWSPVKVNSEVMIATWDSPQPPLESYFVLNAVASLGFVYAIESDFGPAHKDSYTEVGALPILTAMKPPARFYPPLDNVVELDKGNHVSGFYTATASMVSDEFPISNLDVGSISIASAMITPMRTPEEVATAGIFSGGITEHVAKESFFPSTEEPQSYAEVSNLAQNIAVVAKYQDIRLPLTIGQVDLIAFNIVSTVDYPPTNAAAGYGVLSSVAQNVARKTNYLPANKLNSLSLTTLTSANVAFSTEFPDKDAIFSRIESRQVATSLAMGAEYPDKDTAYSSVISDSVLQNVMRVDSSLYQLPRPAQRHRTRIVCKMIYGYKNR
ncbi:hypothetical protein JT321_gp11 [Providencia phage Kokobel1]|uniref:Uncharacterized protein n=1 Tax=Providencia phage Kokobel1 TaxID=2783540 RepID=A0A873WQR2_9CAUD|nr:hypothetical protein JT321_gp11 [Providencia phage Kokobel1]QPB11438.1 hypothetical protein [Providencia phage Kokobel1]